MRRVLFDVYNIRIYSYPAMLYVGMVLGIVVGNYAANLTDLNSVHVFIVQLLLTIPALVGARLLFVATHWRIYRSEPARIWRMAEGGSAMQGGLLLSLAVSVPLLAAFKLSFGTFWDVATFTLLTGMMVTKVGCLLNGCCSGRPTEGWFALCLPDHQGSWQRRIPTQLLDAGLVALVLLGEAGFWFQRPFAGAGFLTALAAYAIGRLFLQPMRASQDRLGLINVQQAFSAAFALIAFSGFLGGWLGIF
jgi:phosphatidylglycerol:prolipoprotein diacylglycerol transferase